MVASWVQRPLLPEPAADLCRLGATRGRRWNCDTEMSPVVLPAVSYRDVCRWQRRGAKLPRQRILTPSGVVVKARADTATASLKAVGAQDGVAWSTQVKRRKTSSHRTSQRG